MEFSFDNVKNVIDSQYEYLYGNPNIWLEKVWQIVEKYGLNKFNTYYEKIHVYCLIYGMCSIYCDFCDILTDFPLEDNRYMDFNINYKDLIEQNVFEDDYLIKEYLDYIIMMSNNANEVFMLLKKEFSVGEVFELLYYSLNYSMFSLEEWETDEFYYSDYNGEDICYNEDYERRKLLANNEEERGNYILNVVSIDKMVAFDWLSNCMR